jgi:serine/threonine protein kinase
MTHPNYTFKQSIGDGGMAIVYLAEHKALHQPVAIKVLNKEFVHNDNIRKRFLAEARNLFTMNHPNIIKVTDLIDEGDTVAFVMEYLEGQTLKEYLDEKGKLNHEEIKILFVQMLDAVAYVHEHGLIHRDIKPSNFMISSKGLVKLLDFGIAKNTDTTSAEYTQTGTTQNMGTPMYMSPEQIKSTKEVTAQTDIYSLGVVLWQMVTGKKPYDTNTTSTFELQTKIVNEKLASTNTSFDKVITGATAKNLKDRYSNCFQFKNQLLHKPEDLESTKLYSEKVFEQTIVQEKGFTENGQINAFEIRADNNLNSIENTENGSKKKGAGRLLVNVLAILGVVFLLAIVGNLFFGESYPKSEEELLNLYTGKFWKVSNIELKAVYLNGKKIDSAYARENETARGFLESFNKNFNNYKENKNFIIFRKDSSNNKLWYYDQNFEKDLKKDIYRTGFASMSFESSKYVLKYDDGYEVNYSVKDDEFLYSNKFKNQIEVIENISTEKLILNKDVTLVFDENDIKVQFVVTYEVAMPVVLDRYQVEFDKWKAGPFINPVDTAIRTMDSTAAAK